MFIDLFYLMRARGLNVSMNEWLSLMDALEKGLCRNSLLEFYYLSRAILIKTEADFDKFDEVFLDYFDRIQHIEDIPQELMDWLHDPKNMKKYDKDEVDARTTYDLEKLRQMLEERLQEQHERHDGGQYWVGTGGYLHHGPLRLRRHRHSGGGQEPAPPRPPGGRGSGTSGTSERTTCWTSGPSSWPSAACAR